jgi:hypothetical protein
MQVLDVLQHLAGEAVHAIGVLDLARTEDLLRDVLLRERVDDRVEPLARARAVEVRGEIGIEARDEAGDCRRDRRRSSASSGRAARGRGSSRRPLLRASCAG